MKTVSLEQVRIASPCTESWDTMVGDNRRRFCSKCEKHVHDLSRMSRKEAESLVKAGHVCVQMQKDAAGRVLTKEDLRWKRFRAGVWRAGTRLLPGFLLAALGIFVGACERATFQGGMRTGGVPSTQPVEEEVTRGDVCLPQPPASQPATSQPTPKGTAAVTDPSDVLVVRGDPPPPAQPHPEPMLGGISPQDAN